MKLHSSQGSHYSPSWKAKGNYLYHTNIHRMPRVVAIAVYLRSMNTPQVVFAHMYTFYQSHSSPTSGQSLSCPDHLTSHTYTVPFLLPHSIFLLCISPLNTQKHYFPPFVFNLLPIYLRNILLAL